MGIKVDDRGRGGSYMSEINVIPFVDVMLVLLIIFMVAAPMMTQGIDVRVPQSAAPAMASDEERLVVTVAADRQVYINEHAVDISEVGLKLAALHQNQPVQRGIFLRADESLAYGYVMEVMGLIRQAGIDQIGMVTEPLSGTLPTSRQ